MSDTSPDQPDDVARLLEFVQGRDAPCPLCAYNLRDLTEPRCPECQQALFLTVGMPRLRFEWLVVTIAPGIFSGIAAILLLIPIAISSVSTGTIQWPVIALDAFGMLSGIVAVVLVVKRYRFLRMLPPQQIFWAGVAWAVHVSAFMLLVILVFILN